MSLTKTILLWKSNRIETHGGENNQGARSYLAPATGKNAFAPVPVPGKPWLEATPRYSTSTIGAAGAAYPQGGEPIGATRAGANQWLGVRAFGGFWSGDASDPNTGGGAPGVVNQFDYVTGGPDPRWEVFHVIDCEGFDYLDLSWASETISYAGLAVDTTGGAGSPPNPYRAHFADSVTVLAWGVEVIDEDNDYVTYPYGIWTNANATLAGEGTNSGGTVPAAGNNYLVPGNSLRPRAPFGAQVSQPNNQDNLWPSFGGVLMAVGMGHSSFQQSGGTAGSEADWHGDMGSYTKARHALYAPNSTAYCARGLWVTGTVCRLGAADYRLTGLNPGDRRRFSVRVGRPDPITSAFNSAGLSSAVVTRGHDIRITGLARIYLAVNTVSVPWGTTNVGFTDNPITYLVSSGTGSPSGAPRHLVKGRLFAKLSTAGHSS